MSEKINGWNKAALSAKAKSAGGKVMQMARILFRLRMFSIDELKKSVQIGVNLWATFHQQLCCALSGRNANVCTDKFANLRRLEV